MVIQKDEFLNLFDKDGKKIKTGDEGVDTITIDGIKDSEKVNQGDYTVGIQSKGEASSHKVVSVPGFVGGKDTVVYPSGVTLDKATLALETGATATLVATVAPADAKDKSVTWKSSDATVASVDGSGKVTAVKAGSATITVTTKDGAKTATSKVTVTDPKSEDPKQ